MDLHPDFRDLLSALAATNAEYLVVGGRAVGYARRDTAHWDGIPVSVIGFDDLVAAKKAAGRERDLRDLRLLEAAQRKRKR